MCAHRRGWGWGVGGLLYCIGGYWGRFWNFLGAEILYFGLTDEEEDEDEEEEEEAEGGNRLLGFMFGNVDNSGDLDVDYLDEVM